MSFDHLVISAQSLDEGAAFVEQVLGATPVTGGKHEVMGTHNRLLSLGPEAYLEVIAIDPNASAPAHPRWFDLDNFNGPPRLTNWVARVDDLPAALARAPDTSGSIMKLQRGDLRWKMAVPADGHLPFGGAFPGLISWLGAAHPAPRLPDCGLRLVHLQIFHPKADTLRGYLASLADPDIISLIPSDKTGLRAKIQTDNGIAIL